MPMEVEERRRSTWKETALKLAPYFGIGIVVVAVAIALIARDVSRSGGSSPVSSFSHSLHGGVYCNFSLQFASCSASFICGASRADRRTLAFLGFFLPEVNAMNSKLASLEVSLASATQTYEAKLAETQAAMMRQQAQLAQDTQVSQAVASSVRKFVPQGSSLNSTLPSPGIFLLLIFRRQLADWSALMAESLTRTA